jgi:hypothetical protein
MPWQATCAAAPATGPSWTPRVQACAAPAERRSLQDARTLTLLKEINRSAQPVRVA